MRSVTRKEMIELGRELTTEIEALEAKLDTYEIDKRRLVTLREKYAAVFYLLHHFMPQLHPGEIGYTEHEDEREG